jgi:hypothetical protein
MVHHSPDKNLYYSSMWTQHALPQTWPQLQQRTELHSHTMQHQSLQRCHC